MKTRLYTLRWREVNYFRRGTNWREVRSQFAFEHVCDESEVERFTWYHNPERNTYLGMTPIGWFLVVWIGIIVAVVMAL